VATEGNTARLAEVEFELYPPFSRTNLAKIIGSICADSLHGVKCGSTGSGYRTVCSKMHICDTYRLAILRDQPSFDHKSMTHDIVLDGVTLKVAHVLPTCKGIEGGGPCQKAHACKFGHACPDERADGYDRYSRLRKEGTGKGVVVGPVHKPLTPDRQRFCSEVVVLEVGDCLLSCGLAMFALHQALNGLGSRSFDFSEHDGRE
jgi:hypothetical protein